MSPEVKMNYALKEKEHDGERAAADFAQVNKA